LHSDGEIFERGLALLRERGYNASRERVKTIVLVKVELAAELISPAYDSGAREETVAAKWKLHFDELNTHRRHDAPAR
jgi:hypothetical protein